MQNIISSVLKSLSYPPTEDQLVLINSFLKNLWLLRILSLLILLTSLFLWYKILAKVISKSVGLISCLIILISPTFYVLWLAYPIDCIKIFLLILLVFWFSRKKIGKLALLLISGYIVLFSFLTTKERASFVHKIGLKDATMEVQERFAAEDSLTDPIIVPLKIKRIVYNKYYIEFKELINEVIPFFDVESIFFQEIHPLEQKSIIIFVWPEIFLFIGGIFFLIKLENKNLNLTVMVMFLFSFINFLFNPFVIFRKFELILFPISLIMAVAVVKIIETKVIFGKTAGFLIVFLCLYGIMASHNDLNKRPDYWLDNRPYFYDFVFNSIKEKNLDDFTKIYVTNLVGNSKNYCEYYLKKCDKNKFIFGSFNLENTRPNKNTIYAGFAGEFVGSDFKNNIKTEWLTLIKDKGFSELKTFSTRDTIAYKFGNDVVVGESK